MAKGIMRQLKLAMAHVVTDISAMAGRPHDGPGPNYASGLASEGYSGGYQQALMDVDAALRGIPPSNSRYWPRIWTEDGES